MIFFVQAEDGIRYLVRSRGLGDVYKRQPRRPPPRHAVRIPYRRGSRTAGSVPRYAHTGVQICLLYTSDAADERSSVDLGGRRIIKKKKNRQAAQSLRKINTQH